MLLIKRKKTNKPKNTCILTKIGGRGNRAERLDDNALILKSEGVDSNSTDKVCFSYQVPGELSRLNPVLFFSACCCIRLAHVEYRKRVNADVTLQLINMCVWLRD